MEETQPPQQTNETKDHSLALSILASAILLSGAWVYTSTYAGRDRGNNFTASGERIDNIMPENGTVLPISWNDLGAQMIQAGVIDEPQFLALYEQRGGLDPSEKQLLEGSSSSNVIMNKNNSGVLLNLFWAFGLSNKNEILEKGPMSDPKYGSAANFASTGGWTISQGNVVDHYSRHAFVTLTPAQQVLVERVAKNIYRPCCGNSTYFPDCNHGMAMLGLLELMAAQNVSEQDMYKTALQVNAYWFPDNYMTIANYMAVKGIAWNNVDPKEILGQNISGAAGYKKIKESVPATQQKSASCSV